MKIKYQQLSISQLHELLNSKIITAEELVTLVLKRLKKFDQLNAVVTLAAKEALKQARFIDRNNVNLKDNLLFAIPFVTKDNIATINLKTTCSSQILENFIPSYDSTVNQLLKEKQAINIAKSTLDELGMGGDGLYAASGYVLNPWNQAHITGGSSSGSAALVAAGVVPFALGTDTGDSIRKPAAYCGVVGFKPTYGLVSRNGVVPYAPSLDTVGWFTNNVADAALLCDYLIKHDENDLTSCQSQEKNYWQNLSDDLTNRKIAIINYENYQWNDHVKTEFDKAITCLKAEQAKISYLTIDPELLNSLLPVYIIISFAVATSCHASLDGVNFGLRVDANDYQAMMIKTRTAGFGNTVKRRYVIGAYVLSASHQEELFTKAKKVRRLIVNKLTELFSEYDALIMMPTVEPAPKIKQFLETHKVIASKHQFMEDLLLLANFAGCPSITIPLTLSNDLPIGINIMSAPFKDQTVLNIASFLSKKISFVNKLLGDDDE